MSSAIREEVVCNASAEKIWQALTSVEQMKEWYFTVHDFKLETGNVFYFYEPGENKKFLHQCTILEIIPNEKFSHTWTYPGLTKGESVVTWYLETQGATTKVTLTHEHLESFADGGKDFARENFEAGWKEILGSCLKEFAEK